MYILGIESSCDETAAAVVKSNKNLDNILVLSNVIASQISIHQKYGGVIPEVAAREHVTHIIPIIDEALRVAKIDAKKIDYIAVTKGPGLNSSLMSGLETARALSYSWGKPLVEVNHIEGHIYANFIELDRKISYPAVILTVSGGHTNLVLMTANHKLKIIGETLDDAAGEAYDKAAKMMDLGYPGGPIVSQQASLYETKLIKSSAKEEVIQLPRPMMHDNSFNFSFSGLKTALLYKLQKDKSWKNNIPKYCYYYQEAIIEVLIHKTIKTALAHKAKSIMLSGGVSANLKLRKDLEDKIKEKVPEVSFFRPQLQYTTDNAAMIAAAGVFKAAKNKITHYSKISVDPNWGLK
jgi:N6-L-threonylcarbamoyladenine synthase